MRLDQTKLTRCQIDPNYDALLKPNIYVMISYPHEIDIDSDIGSKPEIKI